MLIFTYKLEKYIKKKILPKILLLPNSYIIKGSFRRKIPYITDIDIVNEVFPTINKNNIYNEIIKLINRIISENNSNIILVYITCGTDDRFKIESGSDRELAKIKPLLNSDELEYLEIITKKYSHDPERKLFYINELIWNLYKLRWTPAEVLENKMKLRGGLEITFENTVKKNYILLLQYYVIIGSYPIGIDLIFIYEPINLKTIYNNASAYQIKLANYSNEYYYMLFPFKFFFKNNKKILTELNDLIEKKFGLYKQLMVRIDTYHMLYVTHNLNIQLATNIVTSIIGDVNKLPNFTSNVINKIKEVAQNNPPEIKMKEWDILLDVLYDEINASVNSYAKPYFFKYLELIPDNLKNKYYLQSDIQ